MYVLPSSIDNKSVIGRSYYVYIVQWVRHAAGGQQLFIYKNRLSHSTVNTQVCYHFAWLNAEQILLLWIDGPFIGYEWPVIKLEQINGFTRPRESVAAAAAKSHPQVQAEHSPMDHLKTWSTIKLVNKDGQEEEEEEDDDEEEGGGVVTGHLKQKEANKFDRDRRHLMVPKFTYIFRSAALLPLLKNPNNLLRKLVSLSLSCLLCYGVSGKETDSRYAGGGCSGGESELEESLVCFSWPGSAWILNEASHDIATTQNTRDEMQVDPDVWMGSWSSHPVSQQQPGWLMSIAIPVFIIIIRRGTIQMTTWRPAQSVRQSWRLSWWPILRTCEGGTSCGPATTIIVSN